MRRHTPKGIIASSYVAREVQVRSWDTKKKKEWKDMLQFEKDQLKDLAVDGRKILKLVIKT
jgi:hypothetical protein